MRGCSSDERDPSYGRARRISFNPQLICYSSNLACPIFTAFWAIANQEAGHSLGQTAAAIAALKSGEQLDVLPLSSPTNVAGAIFDATGATYYSSTDLFTGELYDSKGLLVQL
jgi:hypothetical protein